MEESADDRVGRFEALVVIGVLRDVQQLAQPWRDAEVQDVGDPFQDDLSAGVLSAEVEAHERPNPQQERKQ